MILRRLLGRREATAPAPPRPLRPTYAVGDLHGRLDLLESILAKVDADAGETAHDLVFLGDYVDRGPESAALLDRLKSLEQSEAHVTCLLGNHDRMLLDVLSEPDTAAHWLAVGGQETVYSFGLVPGRAASDPGEAADLAAALAAALGQEARDWLASRPLWWRSGDLVAVHALTDPTLPMEAQTAETLTWARPGRGLAPRADGSWVVHGHTIVPEPQVRAAHVAVDTGAWRSGRLTAAVFTPAGDPPRFIEATARP
jgi:serine/threonine protein phosphatase 1